MSFVVQVIAWTTAVLIGGGVWVVFFLVFREPLRMWKRRERRAATITAFALVVGILGLIALAQIVP